MPVAWRIVDDLVWLESADEATVPEWQDALEAVLADPRFRSGMGLLYDRRRIVRVPTPQEVRAAVDYTTRRAKDLGRARWAVVVNGTATYGMGRMAGILLEGTSVTLHVFRDLGEAESWVRGATG